MSTFNFGSTNNNSGGFNFVGEASSGTPAPAFSFGGTTGANPAPAVPAPGAAAPAPGAEAPAPSNFSFGLGNNSSTAASDKKPNSKAFSFGSSNPASGGGSFAFGTTTANSDGTTAAPPSFSFGDKKDSFSSNGPSFTRAQESAGAGPDTASFATSSSAAPAPSSVGTSFAPTASAPFSFVSTAGAPNSGGATFSFGSSGATTAPTAPGLESDKKSDFSLSSSTESQDKKAAEPSFKSANSSGIGFVPTSSAAATSSFGTSSNVDKVIMSSSQAFSFGGAEKRNAADTDTNKASDPSARAGTTSGGGFSFGSKTEEQSAAQGFASGDAGTSKATSSLQSKTSDTTTPETTLGGGLSFGDKKDGIKPAVSGASGIAGFSFGGINAIASPNPSTPAPVDTPTASSKSQTPSTGPLATDTPVVKEKEPVRLEYQTLTVEQIINKFQKELEKDALAYTEEARRVAEYDAILRDSQRDIANLTEQTHRAMFQQQEVEKTLSGIGILQEELDRTIEGLESHLDEVFAATKNLPPAEADRQREQAFSTAKTVDVRLQSIHNSLKDTMCELNAAQESLLPKDTDLGLIFKALNEHQDLLADLTVSTKGMGKNIEHASRLLTQL